MKYTALCGALGCAMLAFCQVLIFAYAPVEKTMGIVQKIFYVHLSVAWWCFASFFTACVCGILYLLKKRKIWDIVEHAAVEWGMCLTTIALLTGVFWVKSSWGVWWTWDPRLTTTLILWFIFAAYLCLRHSGVSNTASAVLAIIGFLDVPLVFLSARMWRSIHPAVFSKSGGLEPEMAITAVACVLCFAFFWGAVLAWRSHQLFAEWRLEMLARKMDE